MKLQIAIAAAALSIAGGAIAAGNQAATTGSTPSDQGASASRQQGSQAMGSMASEENNPTLVRSAQQALQQKGFDVGSIDGKLGPTTEGAVRQFQQKEGLPQSGKLDQETLAKLGVNENQGATSSQGSMQHEGSTGSSSTTKPSSSSTKPSSSSTASSGSYK